jgi:hypothetical protein
MVLGALSVVAACFQQMTIGMLNQATEIRIWLSKKYNKISHEQLDENWLKANGQLPLCSSLAAQQLTRVPFALLTWSIFCYLVGFGVYLGFSWTYHTKDTDLGKNDNRNILIVFLISSILTILVYAFWSLLKMIEEASKSIDGRIDRKIAQNVARKINRALESKKIQTNIEPLVHLRNSLIKPKGLDDSGDSRTRFPPRPNHILNPTKPSQNTKA